MQEDSKDDEYEEKTNFGLQYLYSVTWVKIMVWIVFYTSFIRILFTFINKADIEKLFEGHDPLKRREEKCSSP